MKKATFIDRIKGLIFRQPIKAFQIGKNLNPVWHWKPYRNSKWGSITTYVTWSCNNSKGSVLVRLWYNDFVIKVVEDTWGTNSDRDHKVSYTPTLVQGVVEPRGGRLLQTSTLIGQLSSSCPIRKSHWTNNNALIGWYYTLFTTQSLLKSYKLQNKQEDNNYM